MRIVASQARIGTHGNNERNAGAKLNTERPVFTARGYYADITITVSCNYTSFLR
jgi:hypothetical protein